MRRYFLLIFLVLAIILLGGGYYLNTIMFSVDAKKIASDQYRFNEVACWFDVPEPEYIICGELHTPLSSGAFSLPVVRFLDSAADHKPDPVIYLQGGPGGSAGLDSEGIRYWRNWLSIANLGRDFIVMDPRGVGRSRPALTCSEYDQFSLHALRFDLSQQQEMQQGYEVIKRCFAALQARGFNAEHYGTQVSAQDLRALMSLLTERNPDNHEWNLLGVSYGTRLALTAAAGQTAVRMLILDSVYPAGYGGLQAWPELFDQSVQYFFAWCERQQRCISMRVAEGAGESTETQLDRLMLALEKLRTHPVRLVIPRWDGEAPINMVLNDHRFLSAVFSAMYSHHDWDFIAPAIDAALAGETKGLQTLVESFINNAFATSFSALTFMAVDCRDHPLGTREDYQVRMKQYPLFSRYMDGLWQYQACQFLTTESSAELTITLPPKQPVLLLAGELDPITPMAWAREEYARWPRSQLIAVAGIGHAVINSNACVHRHLRLFLDGVPEAFATCESTVLTPKQ